MRIFASSDVEFIYECIKSCRTSKKRSSSASNIYLLNEIETVLTPRYEKFHCELVLISLKQKVRSGHS